MFFVSPFGIVSIVGWVLLVLVTAGAAVLSILAALRRTTGSRDTVLVIVAAALLAAAVLLAALQGHGAPAPVIVLVSIGALVAAVAGGDPVTRLILARTSLGDAVGTHGGLMAEDGRELLRGGQMIGLLERFAVAGVIIAGFPDALAVIVAIKGVGRFSDLENSAVRERFIIGTFTSWIWASAAACVVLLLRA